MDLLSEASSETRVLAARHISAEQIFPETNNALNKTLLCYDHSPQPDVQSYLQGKQFLLYFRKPEPGEMRSRPLAYFLGYVLEPYLTQHVITTWTR